MKFNLFNLSASLLLLIIVTISSCSTLQPPSLRSYDLKDKGDICVAASIGVNYEIQAAYSPIKHVYIQSGYRHARTLSYGLYSDDFKYTSQQVGIGYYAAIKSNAYVQFGAELFDGSGKVSLLSGSSSPKFETSTVYFKGTAINGIYSYYSEYLEVGIMFGSRIGITKNAQTLIDSPYSIDQFQIGQLYHRTNNYIETNISIFHRFKNRSIFAFNINQCTHDYNKKNNSVRFSLSYQIPFNIRKKNRIK